MYSYYRKFKKKKIIYQKCTMPPIVTLGILIFIVSFVVFAKGLIHNSHEGASIPALSSNFIISDNAELNIQEQIVLKMLSNAILSNQTDDENAANEIYFETLEEHFRSNGMNLSTMQAHDVTEKIIDIQDIMKFEGQTDLSKVSLDGRKVVRYIEEQIYEICGLKLVINLEGDIEKISDLSGNIIYTDSVTASKEDFQVNVLVITLSFIIVSFSICVIIAKKNQLFIKDVIYDGFDEERFA